MTGQGWRQRNDFSWGDFWIILAILIAFFVAFNLVLGYFTPRKICLEWKEIETFEIVTTFSQRIPVIKKEKVCVKLVDEPE